MNYRKKSKTIRFLTGVLALGSTMHGRSNPVSSGEEISGLTDSSIGLWMLICSAIMDILSKSAMSDTGLWRSSPCKNREQQRTGLWGNITGRNGSSRKIQRNTRGCYGEKRGFFVLVNPFQPSVLCILVHPWKCDFKQLQTACLTYFTNGWFRLPSACIGLTPLSIFCYFPYQHTWHTCQPNQANVIDNQRYGVFECELQLWSYFCQCPFPERCSF